MKMSDHDHAQYMLCYGEYAKSTACKCVNAVSSGLPSSFEQKAPGPIAESVPIAERTKADILFAAQLARPASQSIIVVDNFYANPLELRHLILRQDFHVLGNYPGRRTVSYATEELKTTIQGYMREKISDFPIPNANGSDAALTYNGAFQYTTSRDRSWVHMDGFNNWAGVLFLSLRAPVTSGTCFYKFEDGTMTEADQIIINNKALTDLASQDMTKWTLVDRIGNLFNRLVLFKSKRFHMSQDYFGTTKEDGRLFQVFFFSTEESK